MRQPCKCGQRWEARFTSQHAYTPICPPCGKKPSQCTCINRKYAIQWDDDDSYYQGMGGIGPIFGGTQAQAKIFNSPAEAATEIMKHWSFSGAGITEAKWLRKTGNNA